MNANTNLGTTPPAVLARLVLGKLTIVAPIFRRTVTGTKVGSRPIRR